MWFLVILSFRLESYDPDFDYLLVLCELTESEVELVDPFSLPLNFGPL